MKVYVLISLAFIVGIGMYLLSALKPEVNQKTQVSSVQKKQTYVDTPALNKKEVDTLEPSKEEDSSAQLKDHLRVVAMQYEKNMQYPPYSQPLSKKQFDLLNPNIFRSVIMKLDPTKEAKASLKLNAFRIFKDENIEVSVTLTSEKANTYSLESLELLSRQEVVARIAFTQDKENENTKFYSAQYAPSLKESQSWAQELLIKANFRDENNKKYALASGFKYLNKGAELTGVKRAYIDKNELIIPLELEAFSDGKYLVKGNLFTKEGEPIAHVYVKKELKKGGGTLLLKVHASSLVLKKTEGPYILKNISVVKLITSMGDTKAYGKSAKHEYEVNGFSLDRYSTEPYHNEKQEQKLNFLKKISS